MTTFASTLTLWSRTPSHRHLTHYIFTSFHLFSRYLFLFTACILLAFSMQRLSLSLSFLTFTCLPSSLAIYSCFHFHFCLHPIPLHSKAPACKCLSCNEGNDFTSDFLLFWRACSVLLYTGTVPSGRYSVSFYVFLHLVYLVCHVLANGPKQWCMGTSDIGHGTWDRIGTWDTEDILGGQNIRVFGMGFDRLPRASIPPTF